MVFVGTRVPVPEVFERLHGAGLRANLGVLGDLDRRAEVEGDVLYRVWVEQGADVLATDRPAAVLEAVTPAGAPTH